MVLFIPHIFLLNVFSLHLAKCLSDVKQVRQAKTMYSCSPIFLYQDNIKSDIKLQYECTIP